LEVGCPETKNFLKRMFKFPEIKPKFQQQTCAKTLQHKGKEHLLFSTFCTTNCTILCTTIFLTKTLSGFTSPKRKTRVIDIKINTFYNFKKSLEDKSKKKGSKININKI
jgi:hypothetical protein